MSYRFSIFLLLVFAWGCSRDKYTKISVKGSDTEVNLALELAEAYMEEHPNASISISGGGSGVGIAALINGRTNIANSSRPMNPSELKHAMEVGVQPVATVIATDAISIIVHPDVGIEHLTLQDIGNIFAGNINNWSVLGGADIPVSLYGRQSNSGTYTYFRDQVLQGDYSSHLKQMNGTAQIIEAVQQDRGAIGYVGVAYLFDRTGRVIDGLKVIPIQDNVAQRVVSPLDTQAVQRGQYPLLRPLFQITNGEPSGVVESFIQFELSEKGRQIIQKNGYFTPGTSYSIAF